MKKIDIILARYNEKIDWIKQNRNCFDNIFIFNKGEKLDHDIDVITEEIPNVGREAHTYFYFLTNYYDMIDENKIYVFSQAHPNNGIHQFMKNINDLDENTIFPKSMTCLHGDESIFYEKNKGHPDGLPIFNFFYHLFYNKDFIENHKVFYNALWAVNGKDLKYRSKKFYEYCLNTLNTRKNPMEAYVFERLWHYVFDSKYPDWISHYDEIRKTYATGSWSGQQIE